MTDVADAPVSPKAPASVSELIEALGLSWLAGRFGHKNASTVQGWKVRNYIPGEHWLTIVSAASVKGISVSVENLASWHAEERGTQGGAP
ncbi:hypothetical protein [Bosea sp. (in: a-proteobacteria)]|uniref:hypothetical protein n=1 Tax=Bosea sp. (in: a-proteobacteria) TaxID=1871050 RepID=UPI0025BBF71C|nr:hypothetical protein [Bosea sp. (in: a-proteobacteria)]